MSPDKKPEGSPNTDETNKYWQEVVYPDWPWNNKKSQKATQEKVVPQKNQEEIKPIKSNEIPTRIELPCGCFGSLFQNGTLLPHHIKGCDGKELD